MTSLIEKVKGIMSKKQASKDFTNKQAGFYKSYDIRWLKNEPDHPAFNLVAEYESKYGEIQ